MKVLGSILLIAAGAVAAVALQQPVHPGIVMFAAAFLMVAGGVTLVAAGD